MVATDYPFDSTKTRDGYGAIDIVTNFYTPRVIAEKRVPTDETFRDQVRMADSHRRGLTPEQYIEKMDRAGIERSLLIAVRCGDLPHEGLDRDSLRDTCTRPVRPIRIAFGACGHRSHCAASPG